MIPTISVLMINTIMETIYKYYCASKRFLAVTKNGKDVGKLEECIYLNNNLIGRPDRLSNMDVVEVKEASEWKHAFGQVEAYKTTIELATGNVLNATIELIISDPSDTKYIEMARAVCEIDKYNIRVLPIESKRVNWRFYIKGSVWKQYLRNMYSWVPTNARLDSIYALSFSVKAVDIPTDMIIQCVDEINVRHKDTYTITSDTIGMANVLDTEPWGMSVPGGIDIVGICKRYYGSTTSAPTSSTTIVPVSTNTVPSTATTMSEQDRIIDRFKKNGIPNDKDQVISTACKNHHLDVLTYIVSRGANDWNGIARNAAKGGYLDIIKWTVSKGANEWNTIAGSAAVKGHLNIIEWAVGNGANDWNGIASKATPRGHQNIINYINNVRK